MICEYCGSELEYETTSCKRCGAPCRFIKRPIQEPTSEKVSVKGTNMTDEIRPMGSPDLSFLKKNVAASNVAASNVAESEISPYKRIVFVFLGIVFGCLGLHFLYARRFILFGIVLIIFLLAMSFDASSVVGLVAVISFISSLMVSTDGENRKMLWW